MLTWAFITAWNPGSQLLPSHENAVRHQQFEQDLRLLGYEMFAGAGEPSDSVWAPEQSLLILGVSEPEAIRLGRKYGQAAIVVGQINEPAKLISCDPSVPQDVQA